MSFGAVDTSGRSRNGRGIAGQHLPALKINVRLGRRFPAHRNLPAFRKDLKVIRAPEWSYACRLANQ